jgi:hypothetical protein
MNPLPAPNTHSQGISYNTAYRSICYPRCMGHGSSLIPSTTQRKVRLLWIISVPNCVHKKTAAQHIRSRIHASPWHHCIIRILFNNILPSVSDALGFLKLSVHMTDDNSQQKLWLAQNIYFNLDRLLLHRDFRRTSVTTLRERIYNTSCYSVIYGSGYNIIQRPTFQNRALSVNW